MQSVRFDANFNGAQAVLTQVRQLSQEAYPAPNCIMVRAEFERLAARRPDQFLLALDKESDGFFCYNAEAATTSLRTLEETMVSVGIDQVRTLLARALGELVYEAVIDGFDLNQAYHAWLKP